MLCVDQVHCCNYFIAFHRHPPYFTYYLPTMGSQVALNLRLSQITLCAPLQSCAISWPYMFRSGIAGSWGIRILNFTKFFQIVLQIVCTGLLSHQQHCIFLIFAFLVDVKWCIILVLIRIYLTTSEFEHFCIFC